MVGGVIFYEGTGGPDRTRRTKRALLRQFELGERRFGGGLVRRKQLSRALIFPVGGRGLQLPSLSGFVLRSKP